MKRIAIETMVILLIGGAARAGLLFYRMAALGISPLQNAPQGIEYLNLGRALLSQWNWSDGYFAARPPLMPLLVAGVYGVFGDSEVALALANVIVGAATAVVAYALALRLTGGEWPARLAGLLTAIDPASIANSINLQAETLTNFLLALSMLWLALVIQRRRLRDAALAGLWLGLATLARPTTIYLFAFCLPLFVVLLRKESLKLYPAFAILPVLFILGWSGRNQIHIGEFTYSTVGDFNLLFYRAVSVERWANAGKSDDVIRREFAAEVERRMGSPVDISQIDSGYFWRNFSPTDGRRVRVMRVMALEVFRAHPLWYLATLPGGVFRMYAYTSLYGSPFLPELLYNLAFYTAAIIGVVVCWKRRDWPALWITLTVIGYVTLATIVSQTTGMDTRMRTSTTTALAVLGAIAVVWIRDKWLSLWLRKGRRTSAVEGGGGVLRL